MNMLVIIRVLFVVLNVFAIACSSTDTAYKQYKDMESIAHQGEIVYKHYKTSDFATAKSALLTYIVDLDKQTQSYPAERMTFQMDIMLTYIRLAKLEEKNNGSETEFFAKKAEEQCDLLKLKNQNCVFEKLRTFADKIDQVEPK